MQAYDYDQPRESEQGRALKRRKLKVSLVNYLLCFLCSSLLLA
jgi:hypothetical protein